MIATAHQRTHRKRCRWCQRIRPMRKSQQFCDHTCAQKFRQVNLTPAERRAEMAKARAASLKARAARRMATLLPLLTSDPITALLEARELGYHAGYSAGLRTGNRKAERWIARQEREWLAEEGTPR